MINNEGGIKAVLFDKDGTLLELDKTWVGAITHVLDNYAYHRLEGEDKDRKLKDLKEYIGFEEDTIVKDSLLASGTNKDFSALLAKYLGLDPSKVYQEVRTILIEYMKNNLDNVVEKEGATDLIKKLDAQGYLLGIVTSDETEIARLMLEHVGILDYFKYIGGSDRYHKKPHPQMADVFCEKFDLKSREVIYVGDSKVDLEFSRHLGGFIGIDTDFEGEINLSKLEEVENTKFFVR